MHSFANGEIVHQHYHGNVVMQNNPSGGPSHNNQAMLNSETLRQQRQAILEREDHTTASDDRRRSQMKATFDGNHSLAGVAVGNSSNAATGARMMA